ALIFIACTLLRRARPRAAVEGSARWRVGVRVVRPSPRERSATAIAARSAHRGALRMATTAGLLAPGSTSDDTFPERCVTQSAPVALSSSSPDTVAGAAPASHRLPDRWSSYWNWSRGA